MRIGIVGAGRIGGNAARLFAKAGHEVLVSFSRDADRLGALAAETGGRTGTPREAVEFGDVVLLSVPWLLVDEVLAQAGSLDGKIVIDTTNQFGREGWENLGLFLCGDDEDAKQVVARLIDEAGFTAVDMGGTADAAPMEAPRRPGAVYGEEVHEQEARAFVAKLRAT